MKELSSPYEIPEGVKEESLILNGKRVHYLEGGKGETVLLVHGWLGSSNGFIYVLPRLAEKYHVIAPDLPGFGLRTKDNSWFSEEFDQQHTIFSYVSFLHSFINSKSVEKVNLVGVSMGGTIALEFARKYPEETHKLVVYEPTLGGKEISLILRGMSKVSKIKRTRKFLRWIVVQGEKMDKVFNRRIRKEDQRAMLNELYGGFLRSAAESAQDLSRGLDLNDYKEIKASTLITYGNLKNPFLSLKTIERLKQVIPNVEVIKSPEVGHDFIREDPEKFSKLVMNFLVEE